MESDEPTPVWYLDEQPDTCSGADNIVNRRLNRRQEPITQLRALALVPPASFLDIRSRGWADNNRLHWVRLRIRSSTSSQGMPVGPSRSRSSSLRFNSSHCAFVSGIASGVSDKLSQTCSRSSNRSSALRLSMSIASIN